MKKLKENQQEELRKQKLITLIPLEELQEGMILAKNLRTAEGRILLSKGTQFEKASIRSIHDLAKRGAIKNQIHVIFPPEVIKKLREKKTGEPTGQKQISVIPLKELQAEMVLAEDLQSAEGKILIAKGTKLAQASIGSIHDLAKRGLINNEIHVTL